MRNILIIIALFFITISCSLAKKQSTKLQEYIVTELDSIDNYYIIYTKQISNNEICKIISQKGQVQCNDKILIGNVYKLNLESIFVLKIENKGKELILDNHVNLDCMIIDEIKLCKEYDKGIIDIYRSSNLRGLCYIKN